MAPFSTLKSLLVLCLMEAEEVPANYLELGAWMKKYMPPDRVIEFGLMEKYYDAKKANDWVVQAMVESGRYVEDDAGFVHVLREAA
jgi:hypothetical protein